MGLREQTSRTYGQFRDEVFDQMFGVREAFADNLVALDRGTCLKLFAEYNAMDAIIY